MTIGIYSIINKANGKRYIGMSVDIENRWRVHVWMLRNGVHPNEKLQNAWDKYGESKMALEILERFDTVDIEPNGSAEKHFIEMYDSFRNGYNKSLGGDGTVGFIHDPIRLKKLSEKMKGNKHGLGKKRSDETRRNLSEAFRKRKDLS
ncbi:GIY-YIG nuclease family protein [Polycladomyces subterraneus]|uniref:GIY-YIG nuclease family protein n=1 Tax=Polycladomyces subterraneus TaxID=1016997 RepID=A0ABT8ILY9_9BACL|nr:GIY-YIG nuclease family protein [Polycladomyces subterraneus]MDN4593204.1 GIY-YIG nuclease family protein [Polycladomyces subterraneus]